MRRILTHWLFVCACLLLLCLSQGVRAQVTIGESTPPAKAAILQLKEKDAIVTNGVVIDNETSTKGGIILPRIKLVNAESLEPFIPKNDADIELQKQLHAGLVVFNTSKTAPFKDGVYYWDGKEWNILLLNHTN